MKAPAQRQGPIRGRSSIGAGLTFGPLVLSEQRARSLGTRSASIKSETFGIW